jgi:hypothetical protein
MISSYPWDFPFNHLRDTIPYIRKLIPLDVHEQRKRKQIHLSLSGLRQISSLSNRHSTSSHPLLSSALRFPPTQHVRHLRRRPKVDPFPRLQVSYVPSSSNHRAKTGGRANEIARKALLIVSPLALSALLSYRILYMKSSSTPPPPSGMYKVASSQSLLFHPSFRPLLAHFRSLPLLLPSPQRRCRTLLTTPSRPSPTATTPNARPASTVTHHLSHDESTTHLNKQRLARPNSPHMTIYQPQITWYGSIANRITGVGLSVGESGSCYARGGEEARGRGGKAKEEG